MGDTMLTSTICLTLPTNPGGEQRDLPSRKVWAKNNGMCRQYQKKAMCCTNCRCPDAHLIR
jgi:hypothetical protein